MDGPNKKQTKTSSPGMANGKSISLEADRRLKEIKDEVNRGGKTKFKYNEAEILSHAVLNFPTGKIGELREKRVQEGLKQALAKISSDFSEAGLSVDFDALLKKTKSSSPRQPKKAKNPALDGGQGE